MSGTLRLYRVSQKYDIVYTNPIKVAVGDLLKITKRETNPDWLGWVFCVREDGVGGWVSEKYLEITGDTARAIKAYDATELAVVSGEVVEKLYDEFGWAWVRNQHSYEGWIPLQNLEREPILSDDPGLKVREARNIYYRENGIEDDGGASEKIGRADFGPLTVYVPNFPARVRALARHDLHHILLGTDTSMRGEARVGAFECAAGLGFYFISWFLEPQTIIFGLLLNPRETFAAFKLGRHSQSLYRGQFREEWLEMRVGDLRSLFLRMRHSSEHLDLPLFLLFSILGFIELLISIAMLPLTLVFYILKKAGYE